MKKKSPPYAIIGAVLLGFIAIAAFFKYEKDQAAAHQAELAKIKADDDARINEEKDKPQVTVTPTPTNMRAVLYATSPIEPGKPLSPAFFEKKMTPSDILPDAYTDQTDTVGWFAIRKIEKGDPLTPRNIGKSLPYMSQRIPMGMREISLPIFNAEVNDAGGYIVDGDRVDLLFTSKSLDGTYILKVETVLQNLLVLSVPGSPIKTDKTDGVNQVPTPGLQPSVSFEVTPEQAESLVFLSHVKNGEFSMILRGRKDLTEVKVKPFEAADYAEGFKKVQRNTDKSMDRVKELATKIELEEKNQGQGNTNETPTPPSP